MEQPIRYESLAGPFDEEELEQMDPDNWDWDNPIEGVTVGDPKAILSLRFTFEELDAFAEVAHAQGVPTEEFIKQLALEALHATRA